MGGIINIFKRKCDKCGKNLKLFERTYSWWDVTGKKIKYCEKCNSEGIPKKAKKSDDLISIPQNKLDLSETVECLGYCNFCKKKINSITGFFCKYCQKWFCADHRLPENHKCKGKLKSPPAEYRIIYSGKTSIIKK